MFAIVPTEENFMSRGTNEATIIASTGVRQEKTNGSKHEPEVQQFASNENNERSKACSRGTKRLVSENICSVEGNSAAIFVSKVSPGIFVIKVK